MTPKWSEDKPTTEIKFPVPKELFFEMRAQKEKMSKRYRRPVDWSFFFQFIYRQWQGTQVEPDYTAPYGTLDSQAGLPSKK